MSGNGEIAKDLVGFDPRALVNDDTVQFLPDPVAAIPPEEGAAPSAPSTAEQADAAQAEQVKVANTGGVGAVLRAEPVNGARVGALRDGQLLDVLERRDVGGEEWLHVHTQQNADGWIYGRLVGPAG
jgi:hypothetical protein